MTGCMGCGGPLAPPPARGGRPRKWCSERCRKRSYGAACVDCGARTKFGAETGHVDEPRCASCAVEHRRHWTSGLILERMQEWARVHGEPPAMPDWHPSRARSLHDEARARRYLDANGYWPNIKTVVRVFGTWNAAVDAAGFTPRAPYATPENSARSRRVAA